MAIRALIFDFDGVILDTESTALRCWQEIYAAHDQELPLDCWLQAVGQRGAFDPYLHLASLVPPPFDIEQLRVRRRERENELSASLTMRPGVLNYLETAKSLSLNLAVASSSSRGWVSGHLERHSLRDYFQTLVCAEDVKVHKPDPAPYLAALKILNVRACEAIAIEDSSHGVAAAKAAGVYTVAFPNPVTSRLSLAHADCVVYELASVPLPDLISRAERRKSA